MKTYTKRVTDFGCGILVETIVNGSHIKGEWFYIGSTGYEMYKHKKA